MELSYESVAYTATEVMKANERANTSDAAFFRNSGFFIIITIPFCTLSDKVRCVKREGVHGAGAPVGQHDVRYQA